MPLSPEELERRLRAAVEAAAAAAALLRAEFHRPGGPRGAGSHAEVDAEAEALILRILERTCPGETCLGEELGARAQNDRPAGGAVWVIDPNDGTSPFLKGFRGSAVSIGLVEEGLPVLGVVHAWDGPTPEGDAFAWRRGGALTRNGRETRRDWPQNVAPGQLALVSHEADRKNAPANAAAVAPLRYLALPSIAWRMALVAAGEGDVAVSLGGPVSWDLAGGHALLLGAGGVLLDRRGQPLRYASDGTCEAGGGVFGGAPALARELAGRDWSAVERRAAPEEGLDLCFPAPRAPRPPREVLERARGCLLGLLAGDMVDGQLGEAAETALHLARVLVRDGGYNPEVLRDVYQSRPGTLHAGMDDDALLRAVPLAIFGALKDGEEQDAQVKAWATQDAALTHPACAAAAAALAGGLAAAIREGSEPEKGLADTNAAIAGALLGAVHGEGALPARRRLELLSCRPIAGLEGVRRPRPRACWPVDALVLAERLLVAWES